MCFLVKCRLIFAKNGVRRSQHMFACIGQRDTTKMTVWYVRRDYVFRVNSHFGGEMLPTKSQRWIFHFPSYLVIELFHRRIFFLYKKKIFFLYKKKIFFLYKKKIFLLYKKGIFPQSLDEVWTKFGRSLDTCWMKCG